MIMDNEAVVNEMAAYLAERHIQVPRDWLGALREWVEENDRDYRDRMGEAAYFHVLETDLNVLRCGSLPADVANADVVKRDLTGYFLLQVNSVIDICHSAYRQFKKIEADSDDDDDVEINQAEYSLYNESNRTLDIELTDGVQKVSAMEWEPMPFLSVNTEPGCKILVHGQVECRRGILFLCPENTTFLGGQVEDLSEVNNQFNLLKRKVKIQKAEWEASPDYKPNVPSPTAFRRQAPYQSSYSRTRAGSTFNRSRFASNSGARAATAFSPQTESPFRSRGTRSRRPFRSRTGGSPYRQRTGIPPRTRGRIARRPRARAAGRQRSGATGRPRGRGYTRRPRASPSFCTRAVRPTFRPAPTNVPTSTGQLDIEMDCDDDDDDFWTNFCTDPAAH